MRIKLLIKLIKYLLKFKDLIISLLNLYSELKSRKKVNMKKKFGIKFFKLLFNIRELIQTIVELIQYIRTLKADAKLIMFANKIADLIEQITGKKLKEIEL